MILYLFFFAICFVIDTVKNKSLNVFLKVILFGFLCFGYMTGSDWRAYELEYVYADYDRSIANNESGYVFVSTIAHKFINDFWVYTALLKISFLCSLVYMIRSFINKAYYVVGLSFSGSLLFMVIDCPMRFMMALTFVNLAIGYFFQNKDLPKIRLYAVVLLLCAVATMFHAVSLLVVLLLLTAPLSSILSKTNRYVLFAIYLAVFVIANSSSFFENVFSNVVPFFFEDRFSEYKEYQSSGFITIGTLKNMALLIIILFNRDLILSKKNGAVIFYFAFIALFLQPIVACVHTLFRINILNVFFMDIALAYIIIEKGKQYSAELSRILIMLLVVISLIKDCKESVVLTPYSNSIPYIITGHHLPYSERAVYNYNHHDHDFWF